MTRSIAVMALLGGLVMSLAPAPLNWWGFAWIGLAPLWVAVVQLQNSKSLVWGAVLLWSIAYHGISLRWITGLHPLTWMGVPWLGSVAIVVFAWTFITFWGVASVGIWAGGMNWLNRTGISGGTRVLAGTALWGAIETARSYTALDWTALAYTQSPGNPVILHLGQLSGNLAVTMTIVAVNGLLAEAWCARRDRLKLASSAIGLLLITHLIGGWLYAQPLDQPAADALDIGIVQGNIPTRVKLFAAGIEQALINYSIGYSTLARQGVDAVLTPEGAMPFSWQQHRRNRMDEAIEQEKVPLWLGSFGADRQPDGTMRASQRLFSLDARGQTIGQYDKVKLVLLGESIPFEPVLGKLIGRLSPLRSYLYPGEAGQRFETSFGLVAVGICYDSAFPELFRVQVQQGAEFLVTASNLDPYSTVLMAQHQAHDLMRAIEVDRWAVRATNTGYSGVINPHGQIIWQSPVRQWSVHHERIWRRQGQTLYVHYGNWLTPLLILLSGMTIGQRVRTAL